MWERVNIDRWDGYNNKKDKYTYNYIERTTYMTISGPAHDRQDNFITQDTQVNICGNTYAPPNRGYYTNQRDVNYIVL